MKWVLIIWLADPSNFTVYETFDTINRCIDKKQSVTKGLSQAGSKMQVECRQRKIGDGINRSNIQVKRYVLY
jgi:hypothetical protein